MKTYEISDAAAPQYYGCGLVLSAIRDGQAVAITYVRDILPGHSEREMAAALGLMDDARLTLAAIRLSPHGEVIAARCSSCELVEVGLVMSAASAAMPA